MGAAGLGVGLGGRGLYGLYNMLARKQRGPEEVRSPDRIDAGFPVRGKKKKDDEEKKKLVLAHDKQAGWGSDFWAGKKTQSKTGIPWYLLGTMAAGTGGAVGGWKLMDMILDKRRAQAQEDDLTKAQSEFQEALLSRHGGTKRASAGNTLGEDLDLLFDSLTEKCASFEKTAAEQGSALGDLLGKLTGGYGLYAGGSGLISGIMMYNAAKKRQRRALLDKAKKERERQSFERRPPRIEAFADMIPQP